MLGWLFHPLVKEVHVQKGFFSVFVVSALAEPEHLFVLPLKQENILDLVVDMLASLFPLNKFVRVVAAEVFES